MRVIVERKLLAVVAADMVGFSRLIEDDEINLLSIASYDQFHFNQICQAIKSGKNIIIEKPMCLKFSELKKIFSLIKKKRNKIISKNKTKD